MEPNTTKHSIDLVYTNAVGHQFSIPVHYHNVGSFIMILDNEIISTLPLFRLRSSLSPTLLLPFSYLSTVLQPSVVSLGQLVAS